MTATEEKTPPGEIDRGDVVTLKTDPGVRRVVLGFMLAVPSCYLVRAAGEREFLARRCEIATVEKRGDVPEVLRNGTAQKPEGDWREEDTPTPVISVEQAKKAGELVWEDSPHGSIFSDDHRFELSPSGPAWEVHDYQDGWHVAGVLTLDDAKALASRRAAEVPARIDPDELEWKRVGNSFYTLCQRFGIEPRFEGDTGQPTGKFVAFDTHAEGVALRYSPDRSVAECKAWCQARSRFRVATENGVEKLVQVKDGNGEDIPF